MARALASPLMGRRERLWPLLAVSLACHAAVITAGVLGRPAPIIDLEQKPIVAKLVRLGEKRPEEYLPRKEEAPAPPASAPVPVPEPAASAPPAKPKPAARPAPPPAPGPTGRPDALASALSRIRREQALGPPPAWGDPSGSPEGLASEAEEGDRYLALVTQALQASYRLPATISEKERMFLKATVVLTIEPDGRVSRFRFERRSGNEAFDEALERAIRQTRLPPPPPEMRERYRTVGLGVHFHV
jgi:colicin import membrane protein/protein TonB